MRRVDVSGRINHIEQPREVTTKFGPGQVTQATLADETGQILVTLWNENIGKVTVGSLVTIKNAYSDSYRGVIQLQVGRYGSLDVNYPKL